MRRYLRQLNCMVFGHEDVTEFAGTTPTAVFCGLCGEDAPRSMQPVIYPVLYTQDGFDAFTEAMRRMNDQIVAALTPAFKEMGEVANAFYTNLEAALKQQFTGWMNRIGEEHDLNGVILDMASCTCTLEYDDRFCPAHKCQTCDGQGVILVNADDEYGGHGDICLDCG